MNIEDILKENTNKCLYHIPLLDKYIGYINLIDFQHKFNPIGINRLVTPTKKINGTRFIYFLYILKLCFR